MLVYRKISFFLFFIFFFGSLAFPVLSAGNTQIAWPQSPLTGVGITSGTEIHELIAYLYGWGIGIGGMILFFVLLIAGFEFMTSNATGNPAQRSRAMERITSALTGLVLLSVSFLVLNTINPQITALRQLPPLWDSDTLSDISILEQGMGGAAPCEFAYLYPEENRQGGSRARFNPGAHPLVGDDLPYHSGEGFAMMSEEELNMYNAGDTSFAEGREIINGRYIESPGSCTITFFYTTGFFVTTQRQMGTITLPNDDFSEIMWEEEEATSFRIRNTGIGN